MFFWLCGEHALPKTRVACVSRLIGNSDSTGKATHWQVGVLAGTAFGNKPGELGTPARWAVWCPSESFSDVQNATLGRVAPGLLPGHGPPSELSSGNCFPPLLFQASRLAHPFFLRAAPSLSLWGGCSAGYPVLIRRARCYFQRPYITGATYIAI
jgi:hypothetical protein